MSKITPTYVVMYEKDKYVIVRTPRGEYVGDGCAEWFGLCVKYYEWCDIYSVAGDALVTRFDNEEEAELQACLYRKWEGDGKPETFSNESIIDYMDWKAKVREDMRKFKEGMLEDIEEAISVGRNSCGRGRI